MDTTRTFHGMVPLIAAVVLAPSLPAAELNESAFFETKIRPLLVERCYECHSADKKQKGGLLVDSQAGWAKGGDSGPAIVPGKPDESLLLKAVRATDKDLQMPPEKSGGKLTAAQIADLEEWVRRGAFDPRTGAPGAVAKKTWDEIFAERRNWWSLQPLRKGAPPAVTDSEWTASATDRFLRDQMTTTGIEPSPVTDAATLARRATLVLTGLPPKPEEVDAFVSAAKHAPDGAYAALVDRLMASPHFGERFARHWLDVVRFTETHGNEWNYDAAYAWRYRDYVIRAFNEDLPFDQFAREHIAGDLLSQPRWNKGGRFNESAIGTAFYRFGEVNHDSCVQFGVIGYDIVDNQLDTLTKAFQATTVACARCHDHKLDAISTRDYHSLLATLRSSRSVMHTLDTPEVNRDATAAMLAQKKDIRSELAALWRQDAHGINAAKLQSLADAVKDKAPNLESPLYTWFVACKPVASNISGAWTKLAEEHDREMASRAEFNSTKFTTLADFRNGTPARWFTDGMGLRNNAAPGGDFVVAHEGEKAVKALLPAGVFTFALSDKLNGALRSPALTRTHSKVSFEIVGNRFSLARLVFNNCQLNYNHQHSFHHDDWSWVTIPFPEKSDSLHPYAELLTFWDNPKFPDPLGTLGKDTENQRKPYVEHAKNPRTWWGVRRIMLHDGAETPKPDLTHLSRLFSGPPPNSTAEAAARYAAVAAEVVANFAANRATDDDMRWLDWLLKSGLLSNKASATPRLGDLTAAYREIENDLTLPTTMPGMADEGNAVAQPVLVRGDHNRPGATVKSGYLQALTPKGFTTPLNGSGRQELAQLIANADNPLTARVIVNRVWQWVFGLGLVASPDDFGHLGDQPSHPELLDNLTVQFIADGWSLQRLIRSLVLTRAFQSAAAPRTSAHAIDPQNRLLSHWTARRAEAEVIRDSLLAVSTRLDPRMFGPSVHPFRTKADPEKRLFTGPLDGDGRRSIYLKFQLMEAPHFLNAFNLPGGKVTQGRRESSNTPAQSLALLNDPLVLTLADHWAGHLLADASKSAPDRAESMIRAAFGRPSTESELASFSATIRSLAATRGVAESDILTSREVWQNAAHTLFTLAEFIVIP